MKEIELHVEKAKPDDPTGQINDQFDAKLLGSASLFASKRGCLKSKDFFLSADFDRVNMGFDQVTRLWG